MKKYVAAIALWLMLSACSLSTTKTAPGGSNNIANLWPEAASPKPGFHEKDQIENYLHDQVCSGAIPLKQAQIEIATNWLAVYNRMPKG